MNKKINWWIVIAILVIGIPVGYVGIGLYKNITKNKTDTALDEDSTKISIDAPEVNTVQVNGKEQDEQKTQDDNSGNISTDDSHSFVHSENSQKEENNVIRVELSPEEKARRLEEEARKQAEREEQARIKREELEQKKAERAEQERLKREELEQKKAERAEQERLKREEQARLKAEQEEKARLEKEEKERQKAEREENERQRIAQEKAKKEAALKSEIQSIVAAGKPSSKVPESCTVIVNGNTTDYQSFRMGVNYNSYTNVRVTSIKTDPSTGKVIQINVSASESKTNNE